MRKQSPGRGDQGDFSLRTHIWEKWWGLLGTELEGEAEPGLTAMLSESVQELATHSANESLCQTLATLVAAPSVERGLQQDMHWPQFGCRGREEVIAHRGRDGVGAGVMSRRASL